MSLILFGRQSNKIRNIKSFITKQIIVNRIKQPKVLFTNQHLSATDVQQYKYFSLTQPNYSEVDYGKKWKQKGMLSAALLVLIPTAFIAPTPQLEYLFIFGITYHAFGGLTEIITDYLPNYIGGAKALAAILCLSIVAGLVKFNMNDVGIITAIKKLMAFKGGQPKAKTKNEGCKCAKT